MPSINIFFLIFALWLLRGLTSSSAFTLELIHRDSPDSPLYQPNLTTAQRFLKHAEISLARASHFKDHVHAEIRLPGKLSGPVFTADLYIGTPAVKRTLVFDTGSDVMWIQCSPCTRCFKQDGPIFEPKKSSSFKLINKNHPLAGSFKCSMFGKGCSYSVGYYSGQSSAGRAATETFSFESSLKAPATVSNLVFGCGTSNSGSFPPAISGILGMDREPTSLPRQLGAGIKNRFSYCLSPTTSSYVRFGDEAVIQGRNVQRTPFLETKNKRSTTSYALPLMDLSINGRRLGARFPEGIYIDSGSSLSLLETSVYVAVKNYLASYFASFHDVKRHTRSNAPDKFLCYSYAAAPPTLPTMFFHFKGANLAAAPANLFFFPGRNVFCLAALESKTISILGSFQQRNVRFVFDLQQKMLSFAPEDCSKDFQLGV
ncbi:aspartic proteinase CDR1-like [Salvia splendens]|uniref:aspartic proteinase CDR1-like n=1 Tax=Salvia splendens TaxID=180675 RepID=UPI001C261C9B|nr:aspartic proteinase CDR1-like [Salvia splendens]